MSGQQQRPYFGNHTSCVAATVQDCDGQKVYGAISAEKGLFMSRKWQTVHMYSLPFTRHLGCTSYIPKQKKFAESAFQSQEKCGESA